MSIAPFVPALPMPTATDAAAGGPSGDAAGAEPGAAGFVEALAAALGVVPEPAAAPRVGVSAPPSGQVSTISSAAVTGLPAFGGTTPATAASLAGAASAAVASEVAASGVAASGTAASGTAAGLAPGSAALTGPAGAGEVATPALTTATGTETDAPTAAAPHATPGVPAGQTSGQASGQASGQTGGQTSGQHATEQAGRTGVLPTTAPTPPAATSAEPRVTGDVAATATASPDSVVGSSPLGGAESPIRVAGNPHSVERAAVVQQVFPEVTRLTTSGNGTHRITINLQPEQLGEVRVTLIVRDGAVTVSLGGEAGNLDVQKALSSGAPELRRMLELVGATDTRIFVRDAQGMTSGSSGTSSASQGNQGNQGNQGQAAANGDSAQTQQDRQDQQQGRPDGRPRWGAEHPSTTVVTPVAPSTEGPHPTTGRLDRSI